VNEPQEEKIRVKIPISGKHRLFLAIFIAAVIPALIAGSLVIGLFHAGLEPQPRLSGYLFILAVLSLGSAALLAYVVAQRVAAQLHSQQDETQRLQRRLAEAEGVRVHALENVIEIQEEERRRISRELHDETGQSLTSLLLGLKLIQRAESLEKARELAADYREVLHQTMEEIQWLTYELRPRALDNLGLEAALKRYVDGFARQAGVEITLEISSCDDLLLGPAVETTVYRVVQEALHNAIKHADAKHVRVMLSCSTGNLHALIEDDGTGFAAKEAGETGEDRQNKLGLVGMKERAALVGGALTIEAAAGKGTRIALQMPLEEKGAKTPGNER